MTRRRRWLGQREAQALWSWSNQVSFFSQSGILSTFNISARAGLSSLPSLAAHLESLCLETQRRRWPTWWASGRPRPSPGQGGRGVHALTGCVLCLRSLFVAHSRGRAALVALVAEPARLSPAVRCAIFPSHGRRSGFDQSWHGSAERRPAICAAQQAQCTHSDGCGIALAERN